MNLKNHTNKLKKLIIYSAVPIFDTWPKKFKLVEERVYYYHFWLSLQIHYEIWR